MRNELAFDGSTQRSFANKKLQKKIERDLLNIKYTYFKYSSATQHPMIIYTTYHSQQRWGFLTGCCFWLSLRLRVYHVSSNEMFDMLWEKGETFLWVKWEAKYCLGCMRLPKKKRELFSLLVCSCMYSPASHDRAEKLISIVWSIDWTAEQQLVIFKQWSLTMGNFFLSRASFFLALYRRIFNDFFSSSHRWVMKKEVLEFFFLEAEHAMARGAGT